MSEVSLWILAEAAEPPWVPGARLGPSLHWGVVSLPQHGGSAPFLTHGGSKVFCLFLWLQGWRWRGRLAVLQAERETPRSAGVSARTSGGNGGTWSQSLQAAWQDGI